MSFRYWSDAPVATGRKKTLPRLSLSDAIDSPSGSAAEFCSKGGGPRWPSKKVCEYRTPWRGGQAFLDFHITNRSASGDSAFCPPFHSFPQLPQFNTSRKLIVVQSVTTWGKV